MEKKKVEPEVKRANLSFLQLIFPSFLLLLIPMVIKSTLSMMVIQVLVFGYQYYMLQNFINSTYN